MSGNNIKYKGRERNKRIKHTTTTIFLLLIDIYLTIINQTYFLLYNTLICQVVYRSNIKYKGRERNNWLKNYDNHISFINGYSLYYNKPNLTAITKYIDMSGNNIKLIGRE